MNCQAPVPDLQRLVVESPAATGVAHDGHRAKELHAELLDASPFAGFAPAPGDIEREPALGEAAA